MIDSRYALDFGKCSTENNYAQVDTDQDASYYGTWINPFIHQIISYVEEEIIIKTFKTNEEFFNEIEEMKNFGLTGIDPGFNKKLKEELISIGLKKFLY